jgi:hypothetical protein
VFSAVRNLFVPLASKRQALATHLHRLAAFARWRSVAGLEPGNRELNTLSVSMMPRD